jgi:hypothetical protein
MSLTASAISRATGSGGRGPGRVKLFKEITEVLSDLVKIRDESLSFQETISDKFPQVFVFGDQSCGKSLLLNSMINLKLFPSDDKQCTVRPTCFIREYCNTSHAVATVEYKKMEAAADGSLQLTSDTQEFNLDEQGLPQLYALILRLQKMKHVVELLRVPPNHHSHQRVSAGEVRFDLMKWGDTQIHILVKIPEDRREGNPVEFLQFVDLPGLQVAEPRGVPATRDDYRELVIPGDKVSEIAAKDGAHPEWFTAPWFSFLTVQHLKKPSALGIHCISSQAQEGNIRSVRLSAELKTKTQLLSKTVEVWTKVDFHCPKLAEGRRPGDWVLNFQARKKALFQNILTSNYFVGALHTEKSHDWPLMMKCLRSGLGHTTKEELLREGSQIATLLAEHEERHGILQRLGPIALLEKCVHFIDEGFNPAFVQTVKGKCEETKSELQKYIRTMSLVYPISRHGASGAGHIQDWLERVVQAVLVYFIAGRSNLADIKNPRFEWMEKVTQFQDANMKHCFKRVAEIHQPAFLTAGNTHFCPDIDFLAETFLEWSFSASEGLLQCNSKKFPKSGGCQTPLDSMMESLYGADNAGDKFQNHLPIESKAHNTVKKMLLRLGKSGDDGEMGIFSPCKPPTDHICDDWWYSFRASMESLIEKMCRSVMKCACDYMIAGQEYKGEETPMPVYAKESYTALFEIFEKRLIEVVKMNWKISLEEERAKIQRLCQLEAASQLTLQPDVLRKICCMPPHSGLNQKDAAPRFELIIQSIEGILSSWDAEQSKSEFPSEPSSKDATLSVDSTTDTVLPDFSLECKSYQRKDPSSDILVAFGSKVMEPNSQFGVVQSIRDSVQGLLSAAAFSEVKSSSWTPVPRFQEQCEHLLVRNQAARAGSAVSEKKLPSIRIVVQNANFHYVKPSQHYDAPSLLWCLKVSYDNWIPQIPTQMIFRPLQKFSELWSKMKELGNIDCNPDYLPQNKTLFGEHRYHHADFMRSKSENLQTALNDISGAVMRMSNEACKQALLKWLEFNNTEELYSDREILRFKQSQFSGAVESFWQEAQSCTLAKAKAAVEALSKKDRANSIDQVLNPFVEAVGQVEALKTRIGSRISGGPSISDQDIFNHYSVMKTLQVWRQDNPTAYREFIEKVSSKFRMRNVGNHSSRNFKLEAQFIASIELAQTYMQNTCFKMYSASLNTLQSQLGEAGVVQTVLKVKEEVENYLRRIYQKIDARPTQYQEVLDMHPNLACPISTEDNLRIASEVIAKMFRMFGN